MQTEREVIRLTPSLVRTLRQCGHRELWMRRRGEPRPPFVESPASARGKSVHAALCEFHRRGGAERISAEELLRLLGRCWVREGYPDGEEERLARLQSEEELAAYHERFGADRGTLATERSCELRRELGGLLTEWFGRVDWLRRDGDGALEVVDWKTHGRRESEDGLAADPVTVMYGRLARVHARNAYGIEGGAVRFSHLYVGALEKVTVTLTREMVEAGEAELAALARGLADGRLEAADGPWCEWGGGCPVRAAGECPLFPAPELEGEW